MIKAIIKTKNPAFWIFMHIILGVVCTFIEEFFVLWLFIAAASSANIIASGTKKDKAISLLYLVTYFSSLELLSRMTNAYKYSVPWEIGKYIIFFGAIYGIVVMQTRKGTLGFLLFLLLVPALFLGGQNEITWNGIVFNLLGPFCIAFAVIAFTKIPFTKQQFRQLLKLMLYPIISVLAFVYLKTPDFDSLEFDLGANFETTGGFGSNQVSTVLGLGLFTSFVFFINRWQLTGNRFGDLALMLAFAFQGLLSFSRGGMIGGVLGMVIAIFFISKSSGKQKKFFQLPSIGKYVLPGIIGLVIIFQVADSITGGLLSLRYQGETNATLKGTNEVDLNTLTTGRFSIFQEDAEIWQDNFVAGAGVGISPLIRLEREGAALGTKPTASHVELSRLLADHGLLGLSFFLVLLYIGSKLLLFRANPKYQGVLAALFALALYTTFHAATRTFLTPLLIGMSVITITDIKESDSIES